MVENIQRQATSSWIETSILQELNFPTLEHADMTQVFKIMKGIIDDIPFEDVILIAD